MNKDSWAERAIYYSTIKYPCFVCQAEDELNMERGEMSHPINCGWRIKHEAKCSMEIEDMVGKSYKLEKDGSIVVLLPLHDKIVTVTGLDPLDVTIVYNGEPIITTDHCFR